MKHSLRAFRYRNFRLFFAGQSLAVVGGWVQLVAMTWLVYRLTGSPWLLGLTGFSGQIAVLVLAPFAGVWADRFDRRKLLVAIHALGALQGFALAALAYGGLVQPWHVIALATISGVVMALETPVRSSFNSEMVPAREDLPSAIAFNGFIQNAGRLVGPSLAGILLAVSSEAFCFLVNGAAKLAVIASLAAMRLAPAARAGRATRAWQGLAEGAAYAWNLVPVRLLLPVVAAVGLAATPYQALMPIFAAEVFGGGAETLGFLMGAAGLGGLVAASYLAARRSVRGLARLVAASAFFAGAALIVFAYSRLLALSTAMIAVVGFSIIATGMSVNTLVQTIVEDGKRGRVLGLYFTAFLGMQPLGAVAAGAAASWIGAAHTLAAGGLCCIAAACWLAHQMPLLRAHIRPIYVRLGIIRE